MISKIDGTLTLEIGGKNRKIKYPITAIEEIESYLANRNIHSLVNGFGVTLLITITWIGLKWEDKKLRRDVVASWVGEYLSSTPPGDLYNKIYKALEASGTFGQVEDETANTNGDAGKSEE